MNEKKRASAAITVVCVMTRLELVMSRFSLGLREWYWVCLCVSVFF